MFLNQLVTAILEVASTPEFFSDSQARIKFNADDDLKLSVHFDDGVFVDKDKQRTDELALVSAGVMPKKEYLIRNFGLSEQEADQWVAEVLNEQPSFNSNAYESNTDADGNTDVGAD